MSRDRSHFVGFRLTCRHAAILSAYLAILYFLIIPSFTRLGQLRTWDVVLASLVASPPLMALLVLTLDHHGPVKNWTVSVLLLCFYPLMVLNHDYNLLLAWSKQGMPPRIWISLAINVVVAAYTLRYAAGMVPRICPGCGRRTLVPLMRLLRVEKRSANTCWCGSCGAKFWKDRGGIWREERRTTWLDAPRDARTAGTSSPMGSVQPHPDARSNDRAAPGDRPQTVSSGRARIALPSDDPGSTQ